MQTLEHDIQLTYIFEIPPHEKIYCEVEFRSRSFNFAESLNRTWKSKFSGKNSFTFDWMYNDGLFFILC